MGILKNQSGYSLVETLACISLLGIILFISTSIYLRLFNNPQIILRSEALFLANKEIEAAIHTKAFRDTTYTSENTNLLIERLVTSVDQCVRIEVSVKHVHTQKEIIKLTSDVGE
ncbi:MAG: hypothetical protein FD122_2702 [Stygiobacter sp.]|nr:MAG: hypothetical protein FD122_2702 [Stygiobacter sp.]KAF0214125.1 MAG: hypothetical protein FD178_2711 [Ignavibacteria bacterium]